MESLYAKYMKETQGKEIVETEFGFATYSFGELDGIKHCYIEDIYILPDFRNSKVASKMANAIIDIALERDCKILYGSVDSTLKYASRSMQVLFGYNMNYSHKVDNMFYFKKEI